MYETLRSEVALWFQYMIQISIGTALESLSIFFVWPEWRWLDGFGMKFLCFFYPKYHVFLPSHVSSLHFELSYREFGIENWESSISSLRSSFSSLQSPLSCLKAIGFECKCGFKSKVASYITLWELESPQVRLHWRFSSWRKSNCRNTKIIERHKHAYHRSTWGATRQDTSSRLFTGCSSDSQSSSMGLSWS